MLTAATFRATSSIARGLRRLTTAAQTVVRNRAALRQLNALDERILKDIGLTRGDLHRASTVPFFADPYSQDPFAARRRQVQSIASASRFDTAAPIVIRAEPTSCADLSQPC